MSEKSKKVKCKKLEERIECVAEQVADILLECWLWQEKNKEPKKEKR